MNETNSPTIPSRELTKTKPRKGWLKMGCLTTIALVVGLMMIGFIVESFGPSVSVQGTTGTLKIKITYSKLDLAADQVGRNIYKAAKKHPELTQLNAELELLVAGGVVDKYGKTVGGPLIMGAITESNLDEVRKYEDESSYARENELYYTQELSRRQYSELLDK